MIFQQCK